MHDGPAQSMANLVLQAEIIERLIARDPDPKMVAGELADFKNGVRDVLDDTRRLIFDLRPMTLDDLGLVPTLRKFVAEFGERNSVNAHLRVVGEEIRMGGGLEQTLFRIVQEALNNARKHAKASNVEVVITFLPKQVGAVIRDDGVGMDVEATEATVDRTRHFGLLTMRERADGDKGKLEIRSQLGKGTEVKATFDL
jgi:two-component system, NarL family, sensor histidine kinase DegS